MFACNQCSKAFKRKDHLKRHMVNHSDTKHVCTRCGAPFRRSDCLNRHLKRHKEKDIEAGGEGLGELVTRRKFWSPQEGYTKRVKGEDSGSSPDSTDTRLFSKNDSDTFTESHNFEATLEPELLKLSHKSSTVWNKYNFEYPRVDCSMPALDQPTVERVQRFVRGLCETEKMMLETVNSCGILDSSSVQRSLENFFSGFNLTYPLVHVQSFTTESIYLLTSLVLAGSCAEYAIATKLVAIFEKRLFELPGLLGGNLQLVQALIVCQFVKLFFGDKMQHEHALAFSGVVTHILRENGRRSRPVTFNAALQGYLSSKYNLVPTDGPQKQILLHGILSVFLDHQKSSPGFSDNSWKLQILTALEKWSDDFSRWPSSMNETVKSDPVFMQFTTSVGALYRHAHLLLSTNLASPKKLLPIRDSTFADTRTAVWHASQMIIEGYLNLDYWQADGCFHYDWCLYTAVMVIWNHFKGSGSTDMAKVLLNLSRRTPQDIMGPPIDARPIMEHLQKKLAQSSSLVLKNVAKDMV
ncbi:hypothetical protein HPODL_02411 [Ogataea parapolymorpha DL-1]|uniref:C2H2-type domain-containing protein n=1 Tax=Ogataea parapolymorpha (strain ATCC 26012 / BCRC 20466 / JCM 22074 / NRRL Y-7560 / DL-1) TaxID=871575 RepID=W1Q6Q4_OGAPD|nr:hypothetical protein HPODL_02411 [Ogataea parapolymorpha DL-1]ESW95759.1 hypothetical protein HPODL_02411 [Ogataea parapolymorpha DL-1]